MPNPVFIHCIVSGTRGTMMALLLCAAAVTGAACGPRQVSCGRDNCAGCCDEAGSCQPGGLSAQCGAQGAACQTCGDNQSCVTGSCQGGGGGPPGGGSGDGGCTCTLPHAQAVCDGDGGCAVDTCDQGRRDLDGVAANGCESTCTPLVVSASGSLDVDLKVVQVSGRVTLEGGPAPVGTPRGTVRFLLAESGTPVELALPTAGEAVFSTRLLAGNYRVTFIKSGDCRMEALPCGEQVLHESVSLEADGTLDLDLARKDSGDGGTGLVTVTGVLLRNGSPLPSSSNGQSRGRVVFRPQGSETVVAASTLSASGPATYSVQLTSGVYDVVVEGAPGCNASSGPLPCYASLQRAGFAIVSSGALDLELAVVTLTGSVTLAGQPVPSHPSGKERAALQLINVRSEGPAAISLGVSGPATFSALLYADTFDVRLVPPSGCEPGPLPCQEHTLRTDLAVTTSGAADFDVRVARISGKVTANGAELGASPDGASRGVVSFTDEDDTLQVPLTASGPATWSALLWTGTYRVSIDNAADCPDGPLPCLEREVSPQLQVTSDGAFDVDVPVVTVQGEVRANGEVLPGSPTGSSRGTLSFSPVQAQTGKGVIEVALRPSGSAAFDVIAYPGNYKIAFENQNDCPTGPAPCQRRDLEASRSLSGSSSLLLDLPVIEVTGTVTVDGAVPSAAAAGSRGTLSFSGPPPNAAQVVSTPLAASGDAAYRVRLFPGTYDVFVHNPGPCPSGALPCQRALVDAKRSLSTSGVLNLDLPTATLSGTLTVNGGPVAASPTGASRGVLRFGMWGTDGAAEVRLSPSGAATWTLRLARGDYDLSFSNDLDCPNGAVPCQQKIVAGCALP